MNMSSVRIFVLGGVLLFVFCACSGTETTGIKDFENHSYTSRLIPLSNAEFTIETPYQIIQGLLPVSNGLERRGGRMFGAVNTDGELIIPMEYSSIIIYPWGDSLVMAFGNERASVYDIHGNKVFSRLKDGRNFIYGEGFLGGYTNIGISGHKVVPINQDGQILFDDNGWYYKSIGHGLFLKSTNRFFYIDFNNHDDNAVVMLVDAYGNTLIDDTNVIAVWRESEDSQFGFYSAFCVDVGYSVYGIFDFANNALLTEPRYSLITGFSNGKAIVEIFNGELVIIDYYGNAVINLTDEFSPLVIDTSFLAGFGGGFTALHFLSGDNPSIINDNGEVVAETNFDIIHQFNDEGIAVAERSGLFGYIDSRGNEILSVEFCFLTNIYNGVGFVLQQGQQYRFLLSDG